MPTTPSGLRYPASSDFAAGGALAIQHLAEDVSANFATLAAIAPPPSGGDDRAALQAVIDTLLATGGEVFLGKGTYLITLGPHPITPGNKVGLTLPSGVRLRGAGRRATTIKLMDGSPMGIDTDGGCNLLTNRVLTGGDEDIEVSDLTIDGNSANQTKNHMGLTFTRTRGCKVTRVTVRNIRGTANFPPNETFHFETQLGRDTVYTDCIAVGSRGTSAQTAAGFSADNATNVTYLGCTAYGMSASHGFTHYQCVGVSHAGCRAYNNADHGFNSEESQSVSYTDCHSGGEQALGATPYPDPAGTELGNGGSGFVSNGTTAASYLGCSSFHNDGAGLIAVLGSGSYFAALGVIDACAFAYNDVGLSIPADVAKNWNVSSSNLLHNNTTTNVDLGTRGHQSGPGQILFPAPPLPGSGGTITNPFPCDVTLYVVGGTVTAVRIEGAAVGNGPGHYRLPRGRDVSIDYTAAPTLTFFWL